MRFKNNLFKIENEVTGSVLVTGKNNQSSSFMVKAIIGLILLFSFFIYSISKINSINLNTTENLTSYPNLNSLSSGFKTNSYTLNNFSNSKSSDFKYYFVPDYEELEQELSKKYHTCTHKIWCNVPPPTESFFAHSKGEPFDEARWKRAQAMAASNDPILSMYINKNIFHKSDLLDGDIFFRKYHLFSDYFVSKTRTMSFLTDKGYDQSHMTLEKINFMPQVKNIELDEYSYPLIKLGYFHFNHEAFGSTLKGHENFPMHFHGPHVSESMLEYKTLNNMLIDTHITKPWVGLHISNENWGIFSTLVQNRTAGWGKCCNLDDQIFKELDGDNLKGLFISQHHNISHPKIIVVPRGIPNQHFSRPIGITRLIKMYGQFKGEEELKKNNFVYTSSSSWKPRLIIMDCIKKNFYKNKENRNLLSSQDSSYEFSLNYYLVENASKNLDEMTYYHKLARSKFIFAMPGLGYDTFRLWESLYLGAIPIFERGVGFDRTFWKLPVLLVDDYSEVNEELLRQAYVEAMYRASEFEYFRLRQSFWADIIGLTSSVSHNKDGNFLARVFPMRAEKKNFVRPFEPCDNCIPGKITPKIYC